MIQALRDSSCEEGFDGMDQEAEEESEQDHNESWDQYDMLNSPSINDIDTIGGAILTQTPIKESATKRRPNS